VLFTLLRSGLESSQLSQVLSGDGWWTATRTAMTADSNTGLT